MTWGFSAGGSMPRPYGVHRTPLAPLVYEGGMSKRSAGQGGSMRHGIPSIAAPRRIRTAADSPRPSGIPLINAGGKIFPDAVRHRRATEGRPYGVNCTYSGVGASRARPGNSQNCRPVPMTAAPNQKDQPKITTSLRGPSGPWQSRGPWNTPENRRDCHVGRCPPRNDVET